VTLRAHDVQSAGAVQRADLPAEFREVAERKSKEIIRAYQVLAKKL